MNNQVAKERALAHARRLSKLRTIRSGTMRPEPLCAACGAVLTPQSCKLKCSRCNYSETCSDLLPPLLSPPEKSEEKG